MDRDIVQDGQRRLAALLADADEIALNRETDPVPGLTRPSVPERVASIIRPFVASHVGALIALCSACLAVAAWSSLSSATVPAPPAPITVTAAPSTTPSPSGAPALTVHVLGAVRQPGVVQVPAGSRVADIVVHAGGLSEDADAGTLNLAAPVADGAQIIVGTKAQPGGQVNGSSGAPAASGSTASEVIDLNTATLQQLDALPGVGAITAQRILAWRTEHGRFSSVNQLQEVEGIGPKSFAQLKGKVRV